MTDDRANIKVDRETFRALKNDKPNGVTWDYYLSELLGGDEETEAAVPDGGA